MAVSTTVEVMTWIDNYIALIYIDMIIHPYPNPNTVRCRYYAANFLQNSHNTRDTPYLARGGEVWGVRVLWVQLLTDVLLLWLQYCV